MNPEDEELVERLLARIGTILEDASAIALLKEDRPVTARVAAVARAVSDADKLCDAAAAIS
jgi:Mg-chelatase subunit ChlI